jgi:uncharacterized protein YndB with AHSA1/START domain
MVTRPTWSAIAAVTLLLGGGVAPRAARAAAPATTAMPHARPKAHAATRAVARTGPIHQEVVFAVSPDRVYDALLDSTQFAEFTHMPAAIDRKTGGAFQCFGGMIEGRNIELVTNQRIVQAWRVASWPPGVFSVVRFELTPEGTGTRVVLTHSNYEEGEGRATLDSGWPEHYWEPMKQYLK